MREVIFWGGTGQARVLNECLFGTDNKIVAIFDNTSTPPPFPDVPFHVGESGFRCWMKSRTGGNDTYFLVAVGGQDRLKLHDWLVDEGLLPLTASIAPPTSPPTPPSVRAVKSWRTQQYARRHASSEASS